jgi:hypothetical protein
MQTSLTSQCLRLNILDIGLLEMISNQPVPKKVEAIQHIAPPTTRKQVQSFIGLINYYQDMWPRRSEILATLTHLTSKDVPFQWTESNNKPLIK